MHDVLRAQLSTWLTQALDIGFEVTETDLLALREWIDAGCPGECPDPKGRQNGERAMDDLHDARIEAAAKVLLRDYQSEYDGGEVSEFLDVARAALVAAQGDARPAVERLDLARHYWRSQGYDYDLHGLDGNNDYEMGLAVADAALAALAATQGAAPQAESDAGQEAWRQYLLGVLRHVEANHPHLDDEGVADYLASSVREALAMGLSSSLPSSTAPQAESADCDRDRMGICKRCGMGWDARKVLDGDFACPVLPSSGVDGDDCWHEANCRCIRAGNIDEDKLAEEIGRHKLVHVAVSRKSAFCVCNPSVTAGVDDNRAWFAKHRARAVAEWLKEQGR